MAELYGRVLRLPHRGQRLVRPRCVLALWVALALVVGWSSRAVAQDEPASLAALGRALSSPRADERESAIEALSSLPPEALPSIEARIAELVRAPVRAEDGYEILRSFAHAIGNRDASLPVDIAPGVGPVLASGATRARVRMAERLLLLRSLEHMGTARALVVALDLLGPEFDTFRWEARHIATRSGARAAAMLLRASGMVGTGLAAVGKWGLESLKLDRPATAFAGQSDESIVEIVKAYAAIRHMSGMPAVADLVDDDRPGVQTAAREAMELYGQNGIWQLRRVMAQRLGVDADLTMSWRATMHALYEGLDAKRLAPDYAALDAALAAHTAGKMDEALRAMDALLARAPELPRRREMAPTYAAHGLAELDAGRFETAQAAFDRALLLDGSHPDRAGWEAGRALAEAERALAHGAPSAVLFEAALGSPLTHDRAAARLAAERPEEPAAEPAGSALPSPPPALLGVLGALLLAFPLLRRAAALSRKSAAALGPVAGRALARGALSLHGGLRRALWALPALRRHAAAAPAPQLDEPALAAPLTPEPALAAPVTPEPALAAPLAPEPALAAPQLDELALEGPATLVDETRPAGLPDELTFGPSTRPEPPRRTPSRPRAAMPAELLFGARPPATTASPKNRS